MKPDSLLAGVLVPAFAVRTATDLGVGDTGGLREMVGWCVRQGLGILQLLPVNETSGDNSPYNAISAMALEPTTIEISTATFPELSKADFDRIVSAAQWKALQSGPVNYREVRRIKTALLEIAFSRFNGAADYAAFLSEQASWLPGYTLFRMLMEFHQGMPMWERWPETHRTPAAAQTWLDALSVPEREACERRRAFFAFVQWIAYRQWERLKNHATQCGVQLMGDIPFGVGRASADVWARPEDFDLDWSGGCPPERIFKSDPFTEKWGQNWGIPLYRWEVQRANGFAWWRARVGNIQRIFHFFRIDHVLGFFRIYAFPWTPERNDFFLPLDETEAALHTGGRLPHFRQTDDATVAGREINQRQGEELLRVILQAAGDTRVVAEDLGVVPEYVVPTLAELGIPGFDIPFLMRNAGEPYPASESFRKLSVAAPATHDHPPLRSAWEEGWKAVDLHGAETVSGRAAMAELAAIYRFAGGGGAPPRDYSEEVRRGFLRTILKSHAWMVVTMFSDILGRTDRYNIPGSVGDQNWTNRLPWTVKELETDSEVVRLIGEYAQMAREAGRILAIYA